jgi:hypothetical protein
MKDPSFSKSHFVPNKMKINLNMFGPLVLNRVAGHVHGTDVVTIYNSGSGWRMMKFAQELPEPT